MDGGYLVDALPLITAVVDAPGVSVLLQRPVAKTLADYIQGILSRRTREGKSQVSQSIYNLKDAAKMLNFLQSNNIMDMAGPVCCKRSCGFARLLSLPLSMRDTAG